MHAKVLTREPQFVIAPPGPQGASANRQSALVDAAYCPACAPPAAPRRRSVLLLAILGSVVLIAFGWVVVVLFEQYSASLTELQTDLKHFNEISAELVKKDALRRMRDRVTECSKELHQSTAARLALEKEVTASEKSRKALAREINRLRERLASVEGHQVGLSP
jgi:hypothetical protein